MSNYHFFIVLSEASLCIRDKGLAELDTNNVVCNVP